MWNEGRDTAAGPHREDLRHSPASSPGAQSSTWELSLQQGTPFMVPLPLPVSLLPSLSRTVCSHLPNKPFASTSCLYPASRRPHSRHTHTDQPGEASSPQFCCEIKTCLKRSTVLIKKKKVDTDGGWHRRWNWAPSFFSEDSNALPLLPPVGSQPETAASALDSCHKQGATGKC